MVTTIQLHKQRRRTIVAGIAGNLMEWYDFAIYGYMIPIISTRFFPSENHYASMIQAFSVFAAGYFARPLGGLIFGYIGDTWGRKAVLIWSVSLMGVSTFSIGLLPDVSQIGILAPILLVGLRIFQGLSVGGEYTGSVTFVLEQAPSGRRGFFTSWIGVGAALGFLVGSGVGALVMNLFSEQQIHDWAWRLPFLTGIVIAFVGYIIRRHTQEPPTPENEVPLDRSPAVVAFRDHWRAMLKVMGLALAPNVSFYMIFVYVSSFLTTQIHFPEPKTMDINTINLLVLTAFIPVAGWLSDKFGRKPMLLTGNLALLLLAWPLFWLINHDQALLIFLGQLGFALLIAWLSGANPAAQGELISHRVRVSAFSMAYNICLAIFGGTTPLMAAYLIEQTHHNMAPAWYLIVMSVITLTAVFTIRETKSKDLS